MALFSQFFSRSFLLLVVVHHHFFAADAQKLETNFPASTAIAGSSERLIQLRMLGALPTSCTGFVLTDPSTPIYVTQIKGYAPSTKVHHMAVYGCTSQPVTPCACELRSRSTIFVSSLNSPPDVRFPVFSGAINAMQLGGTSNIQYVFLGVHYKTASSQPDSTTGVDLQTQTNAPGRSVGVHSVMGVGTIDPGQSEFKLDTCVTHSGAAISVFGYQVHTHSLGTLVSVYDDWGKTVDEIGRGNPQFPQAILPYLKNNARLIYSGDKIMVRCVYNTVGLSNPIYTIGVAGQTGTEMCFVNLYYRNYPATPITIPPKNPFVKGSCTPTQSSKFPATSTTLFTPTSANLAKLQLHALYGNQTGIVSIDATHSMNLDLETF